MLAIDDHQVWIEVGYGLEGRIPDGKAGRILDEVCHSLLKGKSTKSSSAQHV